LSNIDLTDADQDRAEELSEVFATIVDDMLDDDEDVDDILCSIMFVVSALIDYKQQDGAVIH
jgi:hypothetical protein